MDSMAGLLSTIIFLGIIRFQILLNSRTWKYVGVNSNKVAPVVGQVGVQSVKVACKGIYEFSTRRKEQSYKEQVMVFKEFKLKY